MMECWILRWNGEMERWNSGMLGWDNTAEDYSGAKSCSHFPSFCFFWRDLISLSNSFSIL
ncbi:MAG: hypothetical protein GTO13_07520 [Proteobacteria bacterium]|nr:hypothetical protein [Pseudomonadota bacterium]